MTVAEGALKVDAAVGALMAHGVSRKISTSALEQLGVAACADVAAEVSDALAVGQATNAAGLARTLLRERGAKI